MNGADRRIVHMTLREFPGVYTESAGEGASRKVQIKPSAA
jgi:predicted RNA-binding protein Jag